MVKQIFCCSTTGRTENHNDNKFVCKTSALQQRFYFLKKKVRLILPKRSPLKYLTCITGLFLYLSAAAQKSDSFYDYNWKPCTVDKARFYSTLQKTDSGWLRNDYFINSRQLQMQALYADSASKIRNGYGRWFYANGNLSAAGRYVNNKQEGVCISFHSNGMMADSASYNNGVPADKRFRWHRNGYLSDSISHINDSTDVHISWFDNGSPESAGYLLKGKLHHKWKYHHRNGNVSAIIVYNKGNIVSKEYFNEDGSLQKDTADREAAFVKGDNSGWKKYLEKSAYWPSNLKLVNTNAVTVGVEFTINEAGKPEDVETYIPFDSAFDEIAVRIIKQSPAWKPALQYNRKIKQRFRQPVTFVQQEE